MTKLLSINLVFFITVLAATQLFAADDGKGKGKKGDKGKPAAAATQKGQNLPWQQNQNQTRPTPDNHRPDQVLNAIPDDCKEILGGAPYRSLAKALSQLAQERDFTRVLQGMGLVVTNVSWQDTGRHYGSSGGNNISDVRLAAITFNREGKVEPITQPIIRLDNFEDKSVDIKMSEVTVPVGNAWGVPLFGVSLRDYLEGISMFTTYGERFKGSLYAERDSEVLVSAQASMMPVPANGEAHFVPAIYNYQSTKEHPAVLVIMVSNRGTTMTVIDNERDKLPAGELSGSGQMLFHNENGLKKPFVLESRKDVAATKKGRDRIQKLEESGQDIAGQSGANQVMMIQVPLRHPEMRRYAMTYGLESFSADAMPKMRSAATSFGARGLDEGVVDVAKYDLGKFEETNGRNDLERDPNVPIRIDVVRYMATDTAELTGQEATELPEQLRGVFEAGKNLGSLVTGFSGHRITRNYEPWRNRWWNRIVFPYIPPHYRTNPWVFLEERFGPGWKYRFASADAAEITVRSLELQK